eukprot:scaffold5172_cov150-Isochrysis_galbana.AAC.2
MARVPGGKVAPEGEDSGRGKRRRGCVGQRWCPACLVLRVATPFLSPPSHQVVEGSCELVDRTALDGVAADGLERDEHPEQVLAKVRVAAWEYRGVGARCRGMVILRSYSWGAGEGMHGITAGGGRTRSECSPDLCLDPPPPHPTSTRPHPSKPPTPEGPTAHPTRTPAHPPAPAVRTCAHYPNPPPSHAAWLTAAACAPPIASALPPAAPLRPPCPPAPPRMPAAGPTQSRSTAACARPIDSQRPPAPAPAYRPRTPAAAPGPPRYTCGPACAATGGGRRRRSRRSDGSGADAAAARTGPPRALPLLQPPPGLPWTPGPWREG